MGTCKLCGKEAQLLKKSHIIPDFMYQELYDEKHTFLTFKTTEYVKDEKVRKRFTGEYEANILCQSCDNDVLGGYETYASQILYGERRSSEPELKMSKGVNPDGIEFHLVQNCDYTRFKLFLLSILWRASISERPFFSEVDLGKHEEVIRKRLLEGNAGKESDYPVQISTFRNVRGMEYDIISTPRRIRLKGHTNYTFLIAGVFYSFIVSSHTKPDSFLSTTIKEEDSFLILNMTKANAYSFLKAFLKLE